MEATTGTPAHVERRSTDFSDAEADEIAALARTQGWQIAAHDYMRQRGDRAYRLAVDEYAAGLRVLLPLTQESRVLVVRSDWGAVALNLAECVGRVVAMDDRMSRLRFLEARREQARATNLELVHGGLASQLPFDNGAFHAAILLQALEDVPEKPSHGRQAGPVAALDEIHRVLAPGGWLLLGVPNRIGLGRSGIVRRHPRTLWGYRQALKQARFRSPRFYAPLPSPREPFFILPLDQPRLLTHFVDGLFTAQDYRAKLEARGLGTAYQLGWALWRMARRLKVTDLARFVVPSYLITARA